jgi:benzoyl-CoA reductase subunit C
LDVDVEIGDNPLKSLSHAYLTSQVPSSCRFEGYKPKSDRLVKTVKERNAEGVIFAAPSFCDPALEDRPCYQQALEAENIRYMSLQYSEDTQQLNLIREQIGTFADSIKLSEA